MKLYSLPLILSLFSLFPSLPLSVTASPTRRPFLVAEAPLAPARLLVESESSANYQRGSRLNIGVPLVTTKGGRAVASSIDYGLRLVEIKGNSSVSIREAGRAAYGGRTIKLDLKGSGRLETRYLISRSSAVTACIYGKGCVELRSSAVVKPLEHGKYVVGLIEGKGLAQDILETSAAVELRAGQYTIMQPDGTFSPARSIINEGGYTTKRYTKTLHVVTAKEGYKINYGGQQLTSVILPVGTPISVISPLSGL
jgi:hypothetical protein